MKNFTKIVLNMLLMVLCFQVSAQGENSNCPLVTNFTASNITTSSADFIWDPVPEATEGYTLNVYELGSNIPTYTEFIPADSELIATATGLDDNTGYDTLLYSNCTNESNDGTYEYFRTLTAIPENDACLNAIDVTCGSAITGTTRGATETEPNMDLCGLAEGLPGIWYSFENTLPVGSDIVFSLCTSTNIYFDSQMIVYAGSCDQLECVDSNNDACEILSEVSITSDTTERYYVYVFGNEHGQGEFELTVSCNSPQAAECNSTQNIFVENQTETTIDMTWDEVPTAVDGYQTFIVLQGDDPLVDPIVYESEVVPQTTTTMVATGLNPTTEYDAYIVSFCDIENDMLQYSEPFTFNIAPLSTESFNNQTFSIFPNPSNGSVTLKATILIDTIKVYNLLGEVVLTKTPNAAETSLDISQLQSGAYFIKASGNKVTSTQKLIKI